ncbi:MAG: hypothetical protein ABIK31_05475, partial [candidate division WOR-3 bacterium]
VFINNQLAPREYYTIDYNQSIITFFQVISETTLIKIKFRETPFSIGTSYYNIMPLELNNDESIINEKTIVYENYNSVVNQNKLELDGSKTIGVSVGNRQGLGLDQATRITLQGNIADFKISGTLSDVNIPIPSDGATKELDEFDKIQIQIANEKYAINYGDNELIQNIGDLGQTDKHVTGLIGNHSGQNFQVNLGYCQAKGIFKRIWFYGQNNLQGPYYLTSDLDNAVIVSGSEKVYLNGKKLVRGSDFDYIIDYSTGTLFFTNRQIINAFMRIEVEFEYQSAQYNRYLVWCSNNWQINSLMQLQTQFFTEQDDKKVNYSYKLSSSDISYLSNIYTDSNAVWLPGEQYVGMGKGNYIRINDHFVFAGIDSGDFDVSFSYVGESQGSYIYDNSIAAFRYVGNEQGNYLPKIRMFLPHQNRLISILYSLKLQSNFEIRGNGIFSQRNTNLFAQKNTTSGYAGQIVTNFQNRNFKIQYVFQKKNKKFYFPYRYLTQNKYNFWIGIKPESLLFGHILNVQIQPISTIIFNSNINYLRNFYEKNLQKYEAEIKFLYQNNCPWLTVNWLWYPKLSSKYQINFTPQTNSLKLNFEFFRQFQRDTCLYSFLSNLSSDIRNSLQLTISSEYNNYPTYNQSHQNYKIDVQFTKEIISVNSILGYQINKFQQTNNNNLFGDIKLNFKLLNGLDLTSDYSQQQISMKKKMPKYIWVGSGLGNYKRDPETNEYYYDLFGDYLLEYELSNELISNELRKLQGNLNFYRWSFLNWDGYWTFEFQNANQTKLQISKNIQNFNLLLFPNKPLNIRWNYLYEYLANSLSFMYIPNQKTFNQKIELYLNQVLPINISYNYRQQTTDRADNVIEQKRIDNEFIGKLNKSYIISLSYMYSEIEKPYYYFQLGRFYLHSYSLQVNKLWLIEKWTNIDTKFILTFRHSSLINLPYDINLTEPKGITPQFSGRIERIFESENFNQIILSGSYSFVKYPRRNPQHNVSIQLNINF